MSLRPLDLWVIIAYLVGMGLVGLYFSRRNNSTEEYFVGNRGFRGWVVGVSMLGTNISAISFLAFPAAAYVSDWRQLVSNLFLPVITVGALVVFIPFFRRGNLTSAFEYLGSRYGEVMRVYGTLSFIFAQFVRLSTILFMLSLPVTMLTGWPFIWVVVAMGVFIGFYTVVGGIDAVIWTDVVQAVVLALGALLCLVIIVQQLPGGLGQIVEVANTHNKFNLGKLDWDLSQRTFATAMLLGIYTWITLLATDQTYVQRYAAAESTRAARQATALFCGLAVPLWIFFFFLGTSIFVFYNVFPDPVVATMQADRVFPYFILTKIPAGVGGLVIAGALAAAMSSLDSSLNSVATVTVVDLLKPHLAKNRSDQYYLRAARWTASVAAIAMIIGALLIAKIPRESMTDLIWITSSIFGGCLVGLFMVGFFTTRVGSRAALIAVIAAMTANGYLALNTLDLIPVSLQVNIHGYWVAILVNLGFVLLAYPLSLLLRETDRDLTGLTVWTMKPGAII